MKLLLIDLEYTKNGSANVGIIQRLFSNQKDLDIIILTEQIHDVEKEEIDGFHIIRKMIHSSRSGTSISLHNAGVYPTLLQAKRQMKELKDGIDYKRVEDFLYHLDNIIHVEDFDAILSVSFPFESHVCASRLASQYEKPWYAYYLDPYCTNHVFGEEHLEKRVRAEEKVLSTCNTIFFTKPIYQDYQAVGMKLDESRIVEVCIPGIREIRKEKEVLWDTNALQCLFVGNLYWDIRDPSRLLECFKELKDEYQLTFVGGLGGDDRDQIIQEKRLNQYENIHFLRPVSNQEAEQLMMNADVLVNIGNSVENQIPSKVFDYLSTGKPILNLYKISNCTSFNFLKDYENAINIYEEELTTELLKEKLDQLKEKSSISYEKIQENYQSYVVDYVRDQIVTRIHKEKEE